MTAGYSFGLNHTGDGERVSIFLPLFTGIGIHGKRVAFVL